MAGINIALEIFGMITSALLLLCCIIEVPASVKQNSLFITMLAINIAVLGCDMMTWVLEGQMEYVSLLYAFNFFVYTLGYVLTAVFTWYLVSYISERTGISNLIAIIIDGFCVVAILLVVLSLFNHMYFDFDNGYYNRGPLFWLSQVYPISIIFADMFIIIKHQKALGRHDTLSLLSYSILPIIAMIIQISVYGITLLYLATTLSLQTVYLMVHVEQNRRMEKQKAELSKANVSIMLSQIQPHFVNNALNTISVLCLKDPKLASRTVCDFASYLRGNMDSLTRQYPIPFDKELEHLNHYLTIEKLRFPQINVIYSIEATDFTLPSLTLQPLVENAIRYGIGCRPEGGTVAISSWDSGDAFHIRIEDNGMGFDPDLRVDDGRSHIGIANTKERVAAMCNGTMTLRSEKGIGTVIEIKLPKGVKQP